MKLESGFTLGATQHAIVIGSLLGDGSMRCKTNAFLEINHSIHQRSYVDWKFGHLADLMTTPPKQREGNGGRVAYELLGPESGQPIVITPGSNLDRTSWLFRHSSASLGGQFSYNSTTLD